MPNYFEALGISVTASIIVLASHFAIKILWRDLFEKYYIKITCRHMTDISGTWYSLSHDPHGNKCYQEISVKQYGYLIEGTESYRIDYGNSHGSRQKVFKFSGILRNDLLSVFYWNADRREKGSGSFTLQVSHEGNVMKGKFSWFDVESNEIESGDHLWTREIPKEMQIRREDEPQPQNPVLPDPGRVDGEDN